MHQQNGQQGFQHITVLLNEAVEGLNVKPDGVYIDGTFGRGGHSRLILSKLASNGKLMVIDRDPQAIEVAKALNDPRMIIVHGEFAKMAQYAIQYQIEGEIDGILLDLGVSSPQLDDPERGFSFMREGPLDMRMDTSKGLSAKDWLLQTDVDELTQVLRDYGEERFARRIAVAIIEAVKISPIETTIELAELIAKSVPFKDKHKHPATRSFQAIRIKINEEMAEVENALNQGLSILRPGGRLSIISFHSLEDRIVKLFINKHSKLPDLPKNLPLTNAQISQTNSIKLRNLGKIKPSKSEVEANTRSRSALLRIAEKIED